MSRIKSYLLGFITLCITFTAFGQQVARPVECNPSSLPAGNTPGADFTILPMAGCITDANRNTGAPVSIINVISPTGTSLMSGVVKFNFNYRDADGPISFPANASVPTTTYQLPGTYWIVMNGVLGTTSYLTCKSVEIINTNKVDIKYDFCNPQDVSVLVEDTPNNRNQSKVYIEWGDGNIETVTITTFPHTINHHFNTVPVNKPKIQGIYTRGSTDICTSDARNLDIAPIEAPKIISLEGLTGGTQNKITIKGGTPDIDFTIEMKPKGGTWTSTGNTIKLPSALGATANATITVPTNSGEYCFRLQRTGICSNSITSEPVCTIKSTSQVLSPKDVKIDWKSESFTNPATGSSITQYQLHYRETPTNLNQNFVPVNASDNPSFTFNSMECSKKYEFWIVGIGGIFPNTVEIKSPPFVVDPATGGRLPSALVGIASVGKDASNNDIVSINMFSDLIINKYNIYKAEGNSTNFQRLATTSVNSYSDPAVQLDKQQYCYKVDYEDACGNTSDLSDPFCTIFLSSAQPNTINWTPFSVSGSPNVLQNVLTTEYTIQIINEAGTVVYTPGSTLTTDADVQAELDRFLNDVSMNGRVTFRILAMQEAELLQGGVFIRFPFFSYSNTYTFITPALLYVPTAFTPNGDGPALTEVFKAYGKFISEFNMIIYNRWGAPIFESNDITIGWDGTENGTPAPPGNYSYKIFGLDHAGQQFKKVGSILLLK
jgi:gliding motility-associated-like protein